MVSWEYYSHLRVAFLLWAERINIPRKTLLAFQGGLSRIGRNGHGGVFPRGLNETTAGKRDQNKTRHSERIKKSLLLKNGICMNIGSLSPKGWKGWAVLMGWSFCYSPHRFGGEVKAPQGFCYSMGGHVIEKYYSNAAPLFTGSFTHRLNGHCGLNISI